MGLKFRFLYNFLPHKKFVLISTGIFASQILLGIHKYRAQCISNNMKSSLLEFNKAEIIRNKQSRVFVMTSEANRKKQENEALLENLKKLYTKYPNLQSYLVDTKDSKTVNDFVSYLKELGYEDSLINKTVYEAKEMLEKSSIILVNKYGDIKAINEKDLEELSKEDSSFNFFEKFTILNNKNSLLELNNHSFVFFCYLNSSKTNEDNYSIPAFKVFRKVFFNLSFFNIKFFVSTSEFDAEIKDLGLTSEDNNCLFMIKRLDPLKAKGGNDSRRIFEINNERFELIKLLEKNEKIAGDESIVKLTLEMILFNMWKKIVHHNSFYFYMKNNIDCKHANEFLNLFFKEEPYYALLLNLKDNDHKAQFDTFFELVRSNSNQGQLINVVVFDSEQNENISLLKTFKDKKFNLDEFTLKKAVFKETIGHHSKHVLKKLILSGSEVNKVNMEKLMNTDNVSFEDNYLFAKPLESKEFKLINTQNFDFLITDKPNSNKVILIQSTDSKRNRNVYEKVQQIANILNSKIKFFYMNGTQENKEFIEKKYGLRLDSFPQMLLVNENGSFLVPKEKYLKYSIDSGKMFEDLNLFCKENNKKI